MYLPENRLLHGGTYRIIRFISAGGFGCTYEAEHIMLGKRVAIKEFFVKDFCNRDETTSQVTLGITAKKALVDKLRKKFLDEAKGLSRLNHPGIVSVSDVFEENGTAYFVMDYIDGKSLGDMVREEGFLPEKRAVGYIKKVSEALRYVHENNRLHLDLKPGNIMVDSNDNPILIDFGASKQYDEESGENTSTLMGKTPGYAPLEQMGNSVVQFTPCTDIYALGATLYKLLTGLTPLEANLLAIGEQLQPLPATISAPTRKAVMAAMQIGKAQRPQSIDEFLGYWDSAATAFQQATADERTEIAAKPTPNSRKQPAPKKTYIPEPEPQNSKLLPILLVTAVVIIGAIFGYFVMRDTKSGHNTSTTPSANIASDYNKDGIEMVYVAGGTFMMGASSNDSEAWDWEKPAHNVTLSSFYIGKYEVTQKQWVEIMGSNPSYFKGDNLPVEQVSWYDIQNFIKKLNAKTGKNYRLPTEAEWEFAARGGNNSRGYKYSGSNTLSNVAWHTDNSGSKTHPVGTKSPNELGIYDMSGNVWEWCSDWFGENYYSNSPTTNPKGPSSGSYRVIRGGCWDYGAGYCKVSFRVGRPPGNGGDSFGFRLAMDAQRETMEMYEEATALYEDEEDDEEEIYPEVLELPEPPKKTEITVITDILDIVTNEVDTGSNFGIADLSSEDVDIVQQAAVQEEDVEEDSPFVKVEQMPSFQGGDLMTFRNWVQSRVRYPQIAQENGISGRVLLSFIIEKDGSLTNIQVLQSPDSSLSYEATRVLKQSPKWKPGKQRNQTVRVKYTLPVDFRIQH